jgi:hypothetical protein
MLVENKFLFVSLPRRGSTSFHYSCLLHDFDLKFLGSNYETKNSKIDFNLVKDSDIMNHILHGHEPLSELQKKFGNNYPIIAVNRDRHSTFYSLFKHVIFHLNQSGFNKISEHFSSLSSDELFFWNSDDLLSMKRRCRRINKYLYNNKLVSNPNIEIETLPTIPFYSEEYVLNVLDILLSPSSYWHHHNKDIIWFDINNLSQMEEWVSNITQKEFKIKNINSSKHIMCNLKLDEALIKKYDNIYNHYDYQKDTITLI